MSSTPITSPSKRKRGDDSVATPAKRSRLEEMKVPDPASKKVDLMAFGLGEFGQLGVYLSGGRRANERKFAFPVNGMQDIELKSMNVQGFSNFVVLGNGRVVSWGLNDNKLLARPATEDISDSEDSDVDSDDDRQAAKPDPNIILPPNGFASRAGFVDAFDGKKIIKVAVGEFHGAALTDQGEVYTWGSYKENDGWLGYDAEHPEEFVQETPKLISVGGYKVVDIAAGLNAVYALTSYGDVYEWGSLRRSAVAVRKRREQWLTPHPVQLPCKAAKIWAGGYSAYFQSKSGALYGWGLNAKGQLGLGDDDLVNHERPTLISLNNVVEVAVGDEHALALTQDGSLYSWGVATLGRTGHGGLSKEDVAITEPREIEFFKNLRTQPNPILPAMIIAGQCHNLVVTSDGALYSFGFGEGCRLGTGKEDDEPVPVKVGGSRLEGRQIVAIAAGSNHNVVALAVVAKDGDDDGDEASSSDEKKEKGENNTNPDNKDGGADAMH